jgi:hypothetical protein
MSMDGNLLGEAAISDAIKMAEKILKRIDAKYPGTG